MLAALLWIILIGAVTAAVVSGIRAIPGKLREENIRKQKEAAYLTDIEKWKYRDMEMYQLFLRTNPYSREKYYMWDPENRPKCL